MVKSGAMIMGGDLIADHQEQDKMGLPQNKTPTKLFGSGNPNGSVDIQIEGLLRNYVNFIGRRIYEALPYTLTTWLLPFRSYTKGEQTITKLTEEFDNMTDQKLWEYLVREIAQPQLMTPMKVATSMKGLKTDAEPIKKK